MEFAESFCTEFRAPGTIENSNSPHEFLKTMLAKIVEATIFEFDIPVRSGGAMTFQRDDLKKGFEPDEDWNLSVDSPGRYHGRRGRIWNA